MNQYNPTLKNWAMSPPGSKAMKWRKHSVSSWSPTATLHHSCKRIPSVSPKYHPTLKYKHLLQHVPKSSFYSQAHSFTHIYNFLNNLVFSWCFLPIKKNHLWKVIPSQCTIMYSCSSMILFIQHTQNSIYA